uniref:hypothetical protein n=1 Tax=Zooshikella ganghwensis TaxID=202772 RepID=UPI00056EF2F0
QSVYNLEVKDYHTYFVGQQGALVHNGSKRTCGASSIEVDPKTKHVPLSTSQIKEISNLSFQGVKTQRILVGNNGKVAVIGRSMGQIEKRGEYGVVDFARKLREKGYETELFAGKQIKQEWFDEIASLRKEHGVEILPDEIIHQTTFYKENIKWAQKLRKEGYTVIDIGNPNNKTDLGPFYSGEINAIFGNAPSNKLIDLTNINGY